MSRRHVSVWLGVLLLLPGCDLPGRPVEADRYQRPEAVLDVETLFAGNCSGCHGVPGRPGPARDLGDPLFLAVIGKNELRRVTAEGVAGTSMPAFARAAGGWLTEAQIDALADGIVARWSTPAAFPASSLPPYGDAAARKSGIAPGDVARGAAVYASTCAECHGVKGEGGSGGAITNDSYLALMSDQALRSVVLFGRPELDMPSFQGYERRAPLGFQQISDVTAWLIAQRRPFPGSPYAQPDVASDKP